MIPTEYPYGSVSITEIDMINEIRGKYFVYDKYGRWNIAKETYDKLKERGIRNGGECSTT